MPFLSVCSPGNIVSRRHRHTGQAVTAGYSPGEAVISRGCSLSPQGPWRARSAWSVSFSNNAMRPSKPLVRQCRSSLILKTLWRLLILCKSTSRRHLSRTGGQTNNKAGILCFLFLGHGIMALDAYTELLLFLRWVADLKWDWKHLWFSVHIKILSTLSAEHIDNFLWDGHCCIYMLCYTFVQLFACK